MDLTICEHQTLHGYDLRAQHDRRGRHDRRRGGDGGAAGAAIKNDGATWTNSGGGTYNGAFT